MNESFGTYSDYLYHRHDRGDDEGAVNLQGKLAAYLREAKTRYIRPIVSDRYDKPEDMFDSHSYPKGALVLHMLRAILGDEIVLQDPAATSSTATPSTPVDTADFIRSVKTVTGQNLDWFFDQWLFKPGHPGVRRPERMGRGQEGRPPQGRAGPGLRQGRARLPRPGRRQDRHGRRRGRRSRVWIREQGGDVRIPGRDQASARQVRRGERADQGDDASPRRRPSFSTSSGTTTSSAGWPPPGSSPPSRTSPASWRSFPAAPGAIPSGRSAGPPSRPWPGDPPPRSRGRGASRRPAGTRTLRSGPRRSRPLAPSRTSASALFIRTSSGRTGASASGPRPFAPWA
ncbi:MAG: hypothetical protein M0C28_39880 [Candidatus Moduliflexus flocculans]|nr:hypothetical protein [Candidatus Moduliflexus flocculans]